MFTHRTLSPAVTVRSRGSNAEFTIATVKSDGASVAVAVGTVVDVAVAVGGAGVKVGVAVFVLVGTAVGVPGAGVSVGVGLAVGVSVAGATTLTLPLILRKMQRAEIVVDTGRVERVREWRGSVVRADVGVEPFWGRGADTVPVNVASHSVTVCRRVVRERPRDRVAGGHGPSGRPWPE